MATTTKPKSTTSTTSSISTPVSPFLRPSYNEEDFVAAGGLPSDFWATALTAEFCVWTYLEAKGDQAGRYSLMYELQLATEDGSIGENGIYVQRCRAGWLNRHAPAGENYFPAGLNINTPVDAIRSFFDALNDGTYQYAAGETPETFMKLIRGPECIYIGKSTEPEKIQLDPKSELAQLFRAWSDVGVPGGPLRGVGLRCRWVRMPLTIPETKDGVTTYHPPKYKPGKEPKYPQEVLVPVEVDQASLTKYLASRGQAKAQHTPEGGTTVAGHITSDTITATSAPADNAFESAVLEIIQNALGEGESLTIEALQSTVVANAKAALGVKGQLQAVPKIKKLIANGDWWAENGLVVGEGGEITIAE
jgi:hypothetical protein